MSSQNPLDIAAEAEKQLNDPAMKSGDRKGQADSTLESGVDDSVTQKFPGSTVTYGSAASGAGDNREIPESEGGDIGKNGRPTKAKDFEGEGGPEDKQRRYEEDQGGNEDILSNVR